MRSGHMRGDGFAPVQSRLHTISSEDPGSIVFGTGSAKRADNRHSPNDKKER
jgi:hypothetical protein